MTILIILLGLIKGSENRNINGDQYSYKKQTFTDNYLDKKPRQERNYLLILWNTILRILKPKQVGLI